MSALFPFPDAVLYHLRGGHPREILRQICDGLERSKGVSATLLTDRLVAAEQVGGSAIGDGVAVVSCRVPLNVAPERLCAFAKLARPVAFKGVEQHPCDIVYVLVSPEDAIQSHLRDLSSVIRALRDQDFVARLRSETLPERLMGLFWARDAALRKAA
ncbi:MAG: hypothetical protein EBQ96_04755 [Proteobacteria bacterium]|nr:hypothetical protein [Pseudomonadota bacterium]